MALALAIAILVGCGGVTLWSFHALIGNIRRADRSKVALFHLERAVSSLKDVRASARAVMLSGDARNAPDAAPAERSLESDLAEIAELFRGDPGREQSFAEVAGLIDAFVARSQNIIEGGRLPADRLPATVAQEKFLMAGIASGIAQIERREISNMAAEQSKLERNALISLVGGITAASMTLVMVFVMMVMLKRQIRERTKARNAMAEANETLTVRMNELQLRSREMQLMSDMSEILQISASIEEMSSVLPQFMIQLFPGFDGAVYMQKPSRNLLDAVATWGGGAVVTNFAPGECWALRKGRPHFYGDLPSLVCAHAQPDDQPTLCAPMIAQGDAIGVLFLRATPGMQLDNDIQFFAKTVADQISLSLANLRLQETLRTRAVRDPLTGLYNRRYMEESLEREIHRARRNNVQIGVMMLDVDHFKRFNDTFGHQGGDALLQQLAHLMQTSVRDEDIVCRYGGEEFALILPETDGNTLMDRADQLRRDAKNLHVRLNGQSLGTISISIGLALAPAQGSSVDSVIAAADSALYEAKRAGRDRVISATGRSELRAVAS